MGVGWGDKKSQYARMATPPPRRWECRTRPASRPHRLHPNRRRPKTTAVAAPQPATGRRQRRLSGSPELSECPARKCAAPGELAEVLAQRQTRQFAGRPTSRLTRREQQLAGGTATQKFPWETAPSYMLWVGREPETDLHNHWKSGKFGGTTTLSLIAGVVK